MCVKTEAEAGDSEGSPVSDWSHERLMVPLTAGEQRKGQA